MPISKSLPIRNASLRPGPKRALLVARGAQSSDEMAAPCRQGGHEEVVRCEGPRASGTSPMCSSGTEPSDGQAVVRTGGPGRLRHGCSGGAGTVAASHAPGDSASPASGRRLGRLYRPRRVPRPLIDGSRFGRPCRGGRNRRARSMWCRELVTGLAISRQAGLAI
jgi:hypothetical protein